MDLTDDQFVRYARHLILDEVGDAAARLLNARVLVVGPADWARRCCSISPPPGLAPSVLSTTTWSIYRICSAK